MPIRVTCRCGQSLSVPDAMAGKSGKCPKCKETLQIPATTAQARSATAVPGNTPSPKGPKSAGSKSPVAAQPKAATSGGGLEQLFAEAGLDKVKGPECPSCKAPIEPGAMLCVRCGFHLTSGQKIKGFAVEAPKDAGEFANRQLNDAQRSLKKETDADEAAKYTGSPWWVSLAIVLGIMTIIVFGVIIVDGQGAGEGEDGVSLRAPATSLRGKIQRLPIANAILLVGGLVSAMVVTMAWIATCATAFRDKIGQGVLCMIPPYAHYYSLAHRKTMGSTMRILWGWSVILIGMVIGLASNGTLKNLLK